MSMQQFESLEQALNAFRQYEKDTKSAWRTSGVHGKIGAFGGVKDLKKENSGIRIFWRHPPNKGCSVDYNGIPFIIVGRKDWNCHQGLDWDRSKKERRNLLIQQQQEQNGSISIKQRKRQPSKKVGCPAMVFLLHIVRFPEYEILVHTERNRKKHSQILKQHISEGKQVEMEHQFILKLPDPNIHNGHPLQFVSAGFRHSLDKRISEKTSELVDSGIVSIEELKTKLSEFVNDDLFAGKKPPATTNRRYYPSDKELEKFVYRKDVTPHKSMVEILIEQGSSLLELNTSIVNSLNDIGELCGSSTSTSTLAQTDLTLKELIRLLKARQENATNEFDVDNMHSGFLKRKLDDDRTPAKSRRE